MMPDMFVKSGQMSRNFFRVWFGRGKWLFITCSGSRLNIPIFHSLFISRCRVLTSAMTELMRGRLAGRGQAWPEKPITQFEDCCATGRFFRNKNPVPPFNGFKRLQRYDTIMTLLYWSDALAHRVTQDERNPAPVMAKSCRTSSNSSQ
jgi:hypothetical protein